VYHTNNTFTPRFGKKTAVAYVGRLLSRMPPPECGSVPSKDSVMMRATAGAKNHCARTLAAHPCRVARARGGRMATKDPAEAFGELVVELLQIIFSLVFPILLISLCAASFILAFEFRLPEFGLWGAIGAWALGYAATNVWFAVALGLFALASIPLTWLALREQELRASNVLLAYVIAAIVFAFLFWLRTVWPYDDNGWQVILYGLIMFCGWRAVVDAGVGTLGIVLHIRRNRPRPVRPPPQQPHGAPREERARRDEPETI
jgi:hypothetical protein